jgi:hypothetical protein
MMAANVENQKAEGQKHKGRIRIPKAVFKMLHVIANLCDTRYLRGFENPITSSIMGI